MPSLMFCVVFYAIFYAMRAMNGPTRKECANKQARKRNNNPVRKKHGPNRVRKQARIEEEPLKK
jgi:hypothetical protein